MNFDRFATRVSDTAGRSMAFMVALAFVIVWAIPGPLFGFSDTWQLVINTSTTVITFLMIFLVQHSQNEDTREVKAMLQAMIEKFDLEQAKDKKLDEGKSGS